MAIQRSLSLFCYSRLQKGSLTSTSHLAPFLRLARVSEFSVSAKLALSLEGDKRLVERADNALSACLPNRFPSKFLLSAKRVDASLSRWHSLSALSSLSKTSTLALLQNNSFLPEIVEKLTLIPYTRLLLSTDKNKAKFICNPTKRTINWEKYIHFVKVFYTKVSRIRGLTAIWLSRQICDLFSFGHYCFWLFCYFCCDLTLLLSVIFLFPLWFDIIAFDYFVISVVIWCYLLPVIMSIVIQLNMPLLLSIICCSLWVILPHLAYCCMYFAMVFLKHQK